jgi:hypothetical protein
VQGSIDTEYRIPNTECNQRPCVGLVSEVTRLTLYQQYVWYDESDPWYRCRVQPNVSVNQTDPWYGDKTLWLPSGWIPTVGSFVGSEVWTSLLIYLGDIWSSFCGCLDLIYLGGVWTSFTSGRYRLHLPRGGIDFIYLGEVWTLFTSGLPALLPPHCLFPTTPDPTVLM